jgi:glyoxylase-like metal-dependent hydrolase (beta-lactamase superfamily II)
LPREPSGRERSSGFAFRLRRGLRNGGAQVRLRERRGTRNRRRWPITYISSARKIHSAWAITGSEGTIVIEALFDCAANDEIFGGLRKLGLDRNKVKYVILSHAHADHDGGARLLQ